MHHALRAKGKIAELASGFSGWVGSWRNFGATGTDDQIAEQVKKWREESPSIVRFWNGLETAAIAAVDAPGECFSYREISYQTCDDVLYCQLPSGRAIPYHRATVRDGLYYGTPKRQLFFEGWRNRKLEEVSAWRGLLTENVVQATARDIFAEIMLRLEAAGYPIVLHTHDEPCAEVPLGFGSIEEFERIGSQRPTWCASWPISMSGGWRGQRYGKRD